MTGERKYRWTHAGEWLNEKLEEGDPATVLQMARVMALSLDGDTIQELFELEMDSDGFFVEVGEEDEEE